LTLRFVSTMASTKRVHKDSDSRTVVSTLKQHGYFEASKVADTLQGSIWSCTPHGRTEAVIVKVTDKDLVQRRLGLHNGKEYEVQENIFKERAILKYLSTAKVPCKAIVKYIEWFEDDSSYFLVEEHGGFPLFEFVQKAHDFIQIGKLPISEWHKMAQLIFKQMVDALDFMHRHRCAHFDISLENMLISEVDVEIDPKTDRMSFILEGVQIKFCDFGLVDIFKTKTKSGSKTNFMSTKNAGKTLYKSPEMQSHGVVDAAKNDVWCLAVSLFMMLLGGCPFSKAVRDDVHFQRIIGGEMKGLLADWKRDHYVTAEQVELMQSMLQYEKRRPSLLKLKQHSWVSGK